MEDHSGKYNIIAVLLIICVSLLTNGYSKAGSAWFLTIEYQATETNIESISLTLIDPKWAYATTLTKSNIPPSEIDDFRQYDEPYGFKFQRKYDFNGDGILDYALVGVYQEKQGNTGRFLLILTESDPKSWKKVFLEKVPGKPGFSILSGEGNKLKWSFCMECDVFANIIWEEGSYSIKWFNCNDCG